MFVGYALLINPNTFQQLDRCSLEFWRLLRVSQFRNRLLRECVLLTPVSLELKLFLGMAHVGGAPLDQLPRLRRLLPISSERVKCLLITLPLLLMLGPHAPHVLHVVDVGKHFEMLAERRLELRILGGDRRPAAFSAAFRSALFKSPSATPGTLAPEPH